MPCECLRVFFVNDTGMLPNPGCRAVRKAYDMLFSKYWGACIKHSLPVRYWDEYFKQLSAPSNTFTVHHPGCFPSHSLTPVEPRQGSQNFAAAWEQARAFAAEKDPCLLEKLASIDIVVVNGEGSIHHNSVRSLSLLALAKTAKRHNKPVILLNATVQGMDPQLAREVFPLFDFIHVREKTSWKFLYDLGIDSVPAADLAFLVLDALTDEQSSVREAGYEKHILLSAGVTANITSLVCLFDTIRKVVNSKIFYLSTDNNEFQMVKPVCEAYGIPVVHAGDMELKELLGFIRQFPGAVSGRHHINIFLMHAGIPFIPLYSNTWKIEGTVSLTGYPIFPVEKPAQLECCLEYMKNERASLSMAARQAYQQGRYSLHPIMDYRPFIQGAGRGCQ